MMRLALIAAALALFAGTWLHGNAHGRTVERETWAAKTEKARADAHEAARKTEQQRYGVLLDALNAQFMEQRVISAGLNADLERLRNRPERRIETVPGDPATGCKGATGAELSGPDARFLVRLAARADQHRAALASCYEYADSVR